VSVFTRLFLLMSIVGIAPVIPTGALLFYYQSQAKVNTLGLHDNLAAVAATAVNRHLDNLPHRLAFTQDLEAAHTRAAEGRELKAALRANPDFTLAALLDKNGREIIKEGLPQALSGAGRLDRSDDPVFIESKISGRVVLSKFDATRLTPSANIVFPLKQNRYLFLTVDFSDLWAAINSQKIGHTGRIFLADENGHIFHFAGYRPPTVDTGKLTGLLKGEQGLIADLPAEEGDFAGAFRKVPDLNLYVLTMQLRDEAFWDIRLTTLYISFFLLAIMTAAYFSALFFTRRMGAPVAELLNGADAIGRGDYSGTLDVNKGWGEFRGLLESFNSMTEELRSYHAVQVDKLLDEKNKNDLIAGLMRDGIILAGEDCTPLYMNHAAREILAGLAAGKTHKEAIAALLAMKTDAPSLEIMADGGKPAHYRLVQEMFRPETSEPVRLLVLRDVSLEHEIDAMKEDFFNSVAHDLRAPLLGMQGYLKLLEHSCKNAEEAEYIKAMKQSSQRLFRLVEDILDIARMESGTLKLLPSVFSPSDCAERAFEALRPLAQEKRITLELGENTVSEITADERLIERVFYNVISNAIKFTPEGGRITFSARSQNGSAVIRIADTGPGISPEEAEKLFRKYHQLENTERRNGYGLGLAICRHIAELHGGTIAVLDEGPGTVIGLTLPQNNRA